MKPFARINLPSAALRRGILVSSLAREGRGKAGATGSDMIATVNYHTKEIRRFKSGMERRMENLV